MRFNLERTGQPIADIDQTGVFFTGFGQHPVRVAGEGLEPEYGVFVGAVFRPHHRKDAQFGEVGLTAQDGHDTVEFVGQHTQFAGGFYGGQGIEAFQNGRIGEYTKTEGSLAHPFVVNHLRGGRHFFRGKNTVFSPFGAIF